MTVKLSDRSEQLVREQVEAGRFSSPDEVVNHLVEEWLADDAFVDPAIEAALLEALESPRHVFVADEFMERAKRRASGAGE